MLVFGILAFVLAAILIVEIILIDLGIVSWVALAVLLLSLLYTLYGYFILPIISHRKAGITREIKNEFVFFDDRLKVSSYLDGIYKGEGELSYRAIYRLRETSKFFFIFVSRNQAYIVDKSTLEGGTHYDIRKAIALVIGKKYTVCSY